MDPKVCGQLLTTHRRGYGVDVEALRGRFPSSRVPAKAPRWDLVDTEGYGGENCVSWCSWMFLGYIGIYRRKNCVSGRPRGPRDRGACPTGGGGPRRLHRIDLHKRGGEHCIEIQKERRSHLANNYGPEGLR